MAVKETLRPHIFQLFAKTKILAIPLIYDLDMLRILN